MKNLKKFQKFALSAEQANKVRGGIGCWIKIGSRYHVLEARNADHAEHICNTVSGCAGCF